MQTQNLLQKLSFVTMAIALSYLIYWNVKNYKKIHKKNDETIEKICPSKIASLNIGLDEILYFVAKEKLYGVSYIAFDPKLSNIADKLKSKSSNIQSLKVDTQAILKLKPDTLFISKFSNTNFVNILSQNNVKIEFFDRFEKLQDIEDNIKRVIKICCAGKKGTKLLSWVKQMKDRLRKKCNRIKTKYQAMYMSYNLNSAGANTIISDIIKLSCLKNIIEDKGFNYFHKLKLEDILLYNPDIIIFDDWVNVHDFFEKFPILKKLNAYKTGKTIQMKSKYFMSTSHYAYLASWLLHNLVYQK